MGKIIALDGISNCGKTTLCKKLESNGWCYIKESMTFVPADFKVACNIEEDIKNRKLFMEIEQNRMATATAESSYNNVVLDRSIFSVLSISYAIFMLTSKSASKYEVEYLNDLFNELDSINYPKNVFVLQTSYETLMERNKGRAKPLDFKWMAFDFVKFQNRFYSFAKKKFPNIFKFVTTDEII